MRQKKKENYKVIIPKAIAQEVIDEPKEFAEKIKETVPELANKILDSVVRLSTAIEQGLIEVEVVNSKLDKRGLRDPICTTKKKITRHTPQK